MSKFNNNPNSDNQQNPDRRDKPSINLSQESFSQQDGRGEEVRNNDNGPKESNGNGPERDNKLKIFLDDYNDVCIPCGDTISWREIEPYRKRMISVVVPECVKVIDCGAFKDCEKLTYVQIPGSVTEIGDFAFRDCKKLEDVEMLNGVRKIGKGAFSDCEKLKFIVFPESVTHIAIDALYDHHGKTKKDVWFRGDNEVMIYTVHEGEDMNVDYLNEDTQEYLSLSKKSKVYFYEEGEYHEIKIYYGIKDEYEL